jgi:hypothetical protein
MKPLIYLVNVLGLTFLSIYGGVILFILLLSRLVMLGGKVSNDNIDDIYTHAAKMKTE